MKWRIGRLAIWSVAVVLAVALAAPLAIPVSAQGKAARPNVRRPPDGELWDVVRTNCISCHGIDDYAFYSLDRDGWKKLITDKHKDAGGVTVSDRDMGILLDWLVAKFGPDYKPFPRTYIPTEITTYFTNPEAFRILNRACTTCHDLSRA